MKWRIAAMVLFVLLSRAGDVACAGVKAGDAVLKGYLVDADCAKTMVTKDNPMEKAAAHTRECALMEGCAASGYGIVTEGKFLKFDVKGSRRAKELIEKSSRKDHLYSEVRGVKKGDGVTVTSIKETDPPAR
jgi:hypothetical protein